MLAACRGIIEEDRYQDFYTQCERQGPHRWLESFFGFLAGLTLGKQEKCFDAIVCTLRSEGKYNHIIQRLQKGKLNRLLIFLMKLGKILLKVS